MPEPSSSTNLSSFLLLGTAAHSLTLTTLKSDLLNVSKSTKSLKRGSISTLEKSTVSGASSSFSSSVSALMPQQGMFMISTVTGFKLLRLEEIGFFEYLKDKRQWQVVLFNQTRLNLKRNTKAEDIVSYSQAFVQISQSAIVNVNYLAMIDGKCCQLYPPFHDKGDLVISRSYLKELQERFYVL